MAIIQYSGETSHPIVELLQDPAVGIADIDTANISHQDLYKARKQALAPFAQGLADIGEFSLELEDIRIIWSHVLGDDLQANDRERPLRYEYASLITGAYAVLGVIDPAWKTLPMTMLQTRELPAVAHTDRPRLAIVNDRTHQVVHNYQSVRGLKDGTEVSNEISENFGNGLQALRGRLFRILGYEDEHLLDPTFISKA